MGRHGPRRHRRPPHHLPAPVLQPGQGRGRRPHHAAHRVRHVRLRGDPGVRGPRDGSGTGPGADGRTHAGPHDLQPEVLQLRAPDRDGRPRCRSPSAERIGVPRVGGRGSSRCRLDDGAERTDVARVDEPVLDAGEQRRRARRGTPSPRPQLRPTTSSNRLPRTSRMSVRIGRDRSGAWTRDGRLVDVRAREGAAVLTPHMLLERRDELSGRRRTTARTTDRSQADRTAPDPQRGQCAVLRLSTSLSRCDLRFDQCAEVGELRPFRYRFGYQIGPRPLRGGSDTDVGIGMTRRSSFGTCSHG